MSKWKLKPKGQQPVDVEAQEKRKKEHAAYISKENPERFRVHHFKMLRERGEKITCRRNFWIFLENWGRVKDWFHRGLTQAERNLLKMAPYGMNWTINGSNPHSKDIIFDESIDSKTLVLMKNSKKRSYYFTAEDWADIIETLSLMRKLSGAEDAINKIIFCRNVLTEERLEKERQTMERMIEEGTVDWRAYRMFFGSAGFSKETLYNKYVPKLYEKEKDAIVSAGCEFVQDVRFEVKVRTFSGDIYKNRTCDGWLFKLPDVSEFEIPKIYGSELVVDKVRKLFKRKK